jgi:hypothetical protein
MIQVLGFGLGGIHAVLLFHVLRLAFLRYRQRTAFPKGVPEPARLQAWQREHAWDPGAVLLAGFCAVVDFLLVALLLDAGDIIAILGLLYAFIGLFFLAYATIAFRAVRAVPERPGSVRRDIDDLRHGATTDLTGTWLLRGWREGDPAFVNLVQRITLEPHLRRLKVRVDYEQWREEAVAERSGFAAFSHEVAEFLIFLVHAEWFAPYVSHYDVVDLELWRDRFDEENRMVKYRFFHTVARKEQIRRAREKGYDPFHLERMFEVHFQGGAEV